MTKIGGSEKARRAALAHTGSLTGNLQAFDVFAREAGIVRAEMIEDLVESCIFLSKTRRPTGRRIWPITNSGAVKSLATEAGEALGIAFPDLSTSTNEKLVSAIHDIEVSNPLDTKRTLSTDQYIATVAAVHDDPAVDMVLIAEELPRAAGIDRKLKNFGALNEYIETKASKPIICFSPVTSDQSDYTRSLRQEWPRIGWLRDLSKDAAGGFKAGAAASIHRSTPRAASASARRARSWRALDPGGEARVLNELMSKDILHMFGLRTPRERFGAEWNAASVVSAAADLTFPVVAKVVSAAVPHKSDAGLVILNLSSEEALRNAFDILSTRCAALDIEPEGLLIAEQLKGGVEVVVGLHHDAEVGPVVMFGAGGVFLELMRDVAFGPPGLDATRARDMIASTRVAKLLGGYRGSPPLRHGGAWSAP